jgi:hypothetical protein
MRDPVVGLVAAAIAGRIIPDVTRDMRTILDAMVALTTNRLKDDHVAPTLISRARREPHDDERVDALAAVVGQYCQDDEVFAEQLQRFYAIWQMSCGRVNGVAPTGGIIPDEVP